MLSPAAFRDVVGGTRRGVTAAALRSVLRAAEVPYALAMQWRNRRYDRGHAGVHRVDVPVISVGNLTLGGTGKTPMVAWLARWLADEGLRAAIVSRGYGAAEAGKNDEARQLSEELPEVPHVQNPDRVGGAKTAIDEHGARAIVLDDGFQHRRLARDLDIVLVDALEPWGFGHVFPRGTLREPLDGFRRADVIALTRSDVLAPSARDDIRRRIERFAPEAAWIEVAHAPHGLLSAAGEERTIDALRGAPVAAFCGLGNPAGFRRTLAACDYDVRAFREFPDHHDYSPDDVRTLTDWAAAHEAAAVVCTHKDLVKLGVERLGSCPLWALTIRLKILAGREAFESKLRACLRAANA